MLQSEVIMLIMQCVFLIPYFWFRIIPEPPYDAVKQQRLYGMDTQASTIEISTWQSASPQQKELHQPSNQAAGPSVSRSLWIPKRQNMTHLYSTSLIIYEYNQVYN